MRKAEIGEIDHTAPLMGSQGQQTSDPHSQTIPPARLPAPHHPPPPQKVDDVNGTCGEGAALDLHQLALIQEPDGPQAAVAQRHTQPPILSHPFAPWPIPLTPLVRRVTPPPTNQCPRPGRGRDADS